MRWAGWFDLRHYRLVAAPSSFCRQQQQNTPKLVPEGQQYLVLFIVVPRLSILGLVIFWHENR